MTLSLIEWVRQNSLVNSRLEEFHFPSFQIAVLFGGFFFLLVFLLLIIRT